MSAPLPRRVDWLVKGFYRYVLRFVRRHFHAVRISRSGAALPTDGEPILVVANHPSWWDPMIAVPVALTLPGYHHYAAMHPTMLKNYPIFGRLGFFPLDAGSIRSGIDFLHTGAAILSGPRRTLWLTAQGEFADVRTRPLNFKSGVGHLAARMRRGWILCVALEYSFWNESAPEALVRIAEPIAIDANPNLPAKDWTAKLEAILTANLDILNRETQSRDPALFRTVHGGKSGVGGGYDLFRRLACWLRFKRFRPAHGEVAR